MMDAATLHDLIGVGALVIFSILFLVVLFTGD